MIQNRSKVMITGSGNLARCICFIMTSCTEHMDVVLVARNRSALKWIVSASSAKQAIFGSSLSFSAEVIDWSSPGRLEELIGKHRPDVIIHTASVQSPWSLTPGSRWGRLVKEVGFGLTTALNGCLLYRLQSAVGKESSQTVIINACYPDAVNPLMDSQIPNLLTGMGNVAIIAAMLKADRELCDKRLQVIAGHYDVAQLIKDVKNAKYLNVWADGVKTQINPERFLRLPADSELNWVTAACVIPQLLAFLRKKDLFYGHIPGIFGYPGGYPVVVRDGEPELDLPIEVHVDEVVQNNRAVLESEGIIISEEGEVSYTDKAKDTLKQYSPTALSSFKGDDVELAAEELIRFREDLMSEAGERL
ncbi:hypothetical protein [Desulfoluna spongiiphila]|uniref:hypothetical protein n=1 Tax=Desulfoluna spongiiphila TaxID=419481 RepID=UPI0012553539|nr:hypothetical protein [Desulfoluna spongiiphila]VVS94977.1 nad(p)-binding domain superfamily [Desulfoluna spongiiphila]